MAYRPDQLAFYHQVVPVALDVEHALQFPHDATICMLAQMYIETAAPDPADGIWKPGRSPLFTRANNPLGMRWFENLHSGDPLPPFPVNETHEWDRGHLVALPALFRNFLDLRDACVAYVLMIREPNYEPAMRAIGRATVEHPGWELFALALGPKTGPADHDHCGYATAPSYSQEIVERVRESHLDDAKQLQAYVNYAPPKAMAAAIDPEIGQ